MNEMLFYRCEKCGNLVALVHAGGGELVCCGQPMTKLKANTVDASKEKHVPVLLNADGKFQVSIGAVPHPMTVEHSIQWIAMAAKDKFELIYLKPGTEPKVEFYRSAADDDVIVVGQYDQIVPNCEATLCNFVVTDKSSTIVTVYAYCNLHGLWSTEINLYEHKI